MKERITGFCYEGHDQLKFGIRDKKGQWKCWRCEKIKWAERDYWRLVKLYMSGDETALEKLQKYHWGKSTDVIY